MRRGEGEGFQRPGLIGKGGCGVRSVSGRFTASACSVGFRPADHVFIAILNLIAFLAGA